MRTLVVGGAGHVGRLTLPYLRPHHMMKVFDLNTEKAWIREAGIDSFTGSACQPNAMDEAIAGCEALLYMAMGRHNQNRAELVSDAVDASVKGLYMALEAAHRAGVNHAVYTSSLSVYEGKLVDRYFSDEDLAPDSRSVYGFTKWLGEEVCRHAVRSWGMSVVALRLCYPISDEMWLEKCEAGTNTLETGASDTARAMHLALGYAGGGYQVCTISGDYHERIVNLSRAKRILGWEPLLRSAVRAESPE